MERRGSLETERAWHKLMMRCDVQGKKKKKKLPAFRSLNVYFSQFAAKQLYMANPEIPDFKVPSHLVSLILLTLTAVP